MTNGSIQRKRAAIVGLVAIVALAAACSSDDDSSADDTTDSIETVASAAGTADETTPETATPTTDAVTVETEPEPTVPATEAPTELPTVVLVHGAFASAASWGAVVPLLEDEGYTVVTPELPLRSVAGDTEVLESVLDDIDGPIVLVGHSYGGIILTSAATDDPDVEALVYVAAFATDVGESISSLQAEYPGSMAGPATLDFTPYTKADGTEGIDVSIKPDAFASVFAADLPPEVAAGAAAAQHPLDAGALSEGTTTTPAWMSTPSWYLIATDDQVIPVAASRAMAARAGSQVVEIAASHAVLVSQPDAVIEQINAAAASIS